MNSGVLKRGIFTLLCFLTFSLGKGQDRFVHFDSNKGLSQGSVHCMFQDSEGFLWIGTQDGLNRFDGYRFTIYRHSDEDSLSLSDSFILSITEDTFGRLWIGTRGGLNCMDRKTGVCNRFYVSETEKHLFQNTYHSLFVDRNNKLWFQHEGYNYCKDLAKNEFRILENPSGIIAFPVQDNNKSIWFYNLKGDVFKADTSMNLIPVSTGLNGFQNYITTGHGAIDECGVLWVAMDKEILKFNTKTKKWLSKKFLMSDQVIQVLPDAGGNIWACTTDGLYRLKTDQFEKIFSIENDITSIPPGSVLCLLQDMDKNIWIGTAAAGVSLFHSGQNQFKFLRSTNNNDAVWSVFQDSKGNIWMGRTSALYLYEMKGKRLFQELDINKNVQSKRKIIQGTQNLKHVISLCEDHQGNIWAGTSGNGIFILHPSGKILQHILKSDNGLTDNTVFYLRKDKNNQIWVSTASGQGCFDPLTKKWRRFIVGSENNLCGNYILSSYQDRQGNTWICSSSGIDKYSPELKRIAYFPSTYDSASFLKQTIVTACTQDSENNLWIATISKGIYELKSNGDIRHFDVNHSLQSNVIYGIQTDKRGNVWASSPKGISLFDSKKNRFYNLNKNDGLPHGDFVLGGFHQNKFGEQMWCSTKGLLLFDPLEIHTEVKIKSPQISSVEINYDRVFLKGNRLELFGDDKIVKIDFVTPSFTHSEELIYQYRLKGFDDKWVLALPGMRSATFTNLNPGDYTFEVKVYENLADFVFAPITRIFIVQHPPFWEKPWFILLVIGIFGGSVYFVANYFSTLKFSKKLKEAEIQQKIHLERERISRDLHDNIGSQLTYVISSLDHLSHSDSNLTNAIAHKNIESLGDFARITMQQLRETIWTLNKDKIALKSLKNRIHEYVNRLLSDNDSLNFTFTFDSETETELNSFQAIQILRIVQEAVNNCLKHASAKNLEIRISEEENNKLILEIIDDGKGISLNPNDGVEHYGMENMKKRAAELNGEIIIKSGEKNGTAVVLVITL